ncbi:MAG: YfhO family protein, partial [Anaerolineales bacterium]|nr:YfhO family protein [Anaerolineales bacterium]
VPQLRRAAPALFVAVAVIDLFAANRPLNVRAPYLPYPPDPVVMPVLAERGFFRVQDDGRLAGHAGCGYGFREVDGVTPYHLAAYDRLLQRPEPERWRLLGVKYVVTWRAELFDANGQRIESEVVAQSEGVDEKGNPTRTHRLPIEPQRAWLSFNVGMGEALPIESANNVTVLHDKPGDIALRVELPASGTQLLVVSEAYAPGWRAWVDGQSAAVRAAHEALLAVTVPPGAHTVEFRYEPQSLAWGAVLSGAGLLVSVMLIFRHNLNR